MKALLLGGTGAMGQYLSRTMADRGDEVYVTTRSRRQDSTIKYLEGDAHNLEFLKSVLINHFDVIIDFMVYSPQELIDRVDILLESTDQYLFLSSSRVFAESETPITEDSPRLLDVCQDKKFLGTDEYALIKAREENILRENIRHNWTIIRPYITYSNARLQLGVMEKEHWLYRALNNHTVVFQEDISKHFTTLTYGNDVSNMILYIIGNKKTLGKAVNVVGDDCIRWFQVFEIYRKTFKKITGKEMKYEIQTSSSSMAKILDNEYQIRYDRLFNRRFDNSYIKELCGSDFKCISPENGLENCLTEFLCGNRNFGMIDRWYQGWADHITRENFGFLDIQGSKEKIKYELAKSGIVKGRIKRIRWR